MATGGSMTRSRHRSGPVLDRNKKTILLFGSFSLSGIKPRHLSSQQESMVNKCQGYTFPPRPATFPSVLSDIRDYSAGQHVQRTRVTKIFIAIDYTPPNKADTFSLQKEKFLNAFSVFVNAINTDHYPGIDMIFQSILPQSGLIAEIRERNKWLQEAVETSQGTWCQFLDCSDNYLTSRGDINLKLYNAGPDTSKKDKARLLNDEGIEVLINRYRQFLKLDVLVFSTHSATERQSSIEEKQELNKPDVPHRELTTPSNSIPTSNIRDESSSSDPATQVMDLSGLIEKISRVQATNRELDKTATVTTGRNEDEATMTLSSCAEVLVETGMSYLMEQFWEFYRTAVIEPAIACQEEVFNEFQKNISFQAGNPETNFIQHMTENFRQRVQTASMKSVADLTIKNVEAIWRATDELKSTQKKIEDTLRENEEQFIKLARIVNFENDKQVLAHIEQMDALITEISGLSVQD
ncbi:hypothetical protein ACHWQZ_G017699 [Mnemiopsis leidyi]